MSSKHTHLEIGVVNRLSHNSFLLKGWSKENCLVRPIPTLKGGALRSHKKNGNFLLLKSKAIHSYPKEWGILACFCKTNFWWSSNNHFCPASLDAAFRPTASGGATSGIFRVILVSAMFALAAKDSQLLFVYLAYFPAISFWFLDGYFLHQERLFRKLYDRVRELQESEIDFSMNTEVVKDQVAPWSKVTLSKTLLAFHGVILVSIIVVTFISIYLKQGGT